MRKDAVCMLGPGSMQEEGITSFLLCPNLQMSLGRQMGNLYNVVICLISTREQEYINNNATPPKCEFS